MTDKSDSDEESYSYTSSKIFYKRSRSKPQDVASTKVYVSNTDDVDDASEYRPVTKWAVDYNNRNYIRSMCNKNKGLHRELKGRPPKFKIHYDNNYFTRSKVNAPKGLHRKIPEIKRKYVPDNDELAVATGWEFDYGPEFDQVEGDVNYIPEGRIIRRGGYRWYGVKRNDSDCDIKVEEERENLLNEELEQELKYGQEFLQSDIPYLEEERNKRYTRGGYRFYEVPRNIHDFKPEELDEIPRDPEWKRKYHCNGVRYLDLEMRQSETDDDTSEHRHQTKKGKPFRRTILNKVYELKKEDSSKDAKRHGTRLSLVPGEGRQSLYEGIPDRQRYETEKTNNVRSVYKKKTEKFRSSREGGEYEEYQTEDTEKSYTELRPAFEERQHRTAEVRSGRRLPEEDLTRKEKGGRRFDDYTHKVKPEDKFKPRRQGRNGSTTDVKQKIETWKEDKFKPRGQGRNGNTSDAGERFETFKEDKYKPRREGRNGNTTDARESFETFKESTLYEKEADERDHRIVEKKSNETFYKKRGFPLKDSAVERRRNKEKYYDRQELPSQKEMIRSQDRRHGNEIYKQTEVGTVFNQGTKIKGKTRAGNKINIHLQHIRDRGKIPKDANSFETKLTADKQKILKKTPPYVDERVKNTMGRKERKTELVDRKDTKIKGKTRDRNNINIHLQHIRDRGKIPKDADNFQAKLTLGTEKVSKKMPPHVDERVKKVLGRIERKIELGDRKDKGEVVKKMPPHVEERIKNIREKLERKIEPADRKHTGQRGRNIYDFSSSDEGIDLMKHKDHPNDRGETHNSGYEKYITKNGSEIWVKKNEKYAELHHKSHR